MAVSIDDAQWLDVTAVNEVLDDGNRWPHGRVTSIHAERIGADFGFSGRVYRLRVRAESGGPLCVVAKVEDAEGIGRAVAFREDNEERLGGHVPVSYGARIDDASNRGLILLEHVYPAVQGNDVTGCTTEQAVAIVGLVAKLHAHTWRPRHDRALDPPMVWAERIWEADRWSDRLTRAASRFSNVFDVEMSARLSQFPAEAASAYDHLQRGSRAWVHRDPHPDNALWRPDGQLVLLDWSNAMIAPPAIDVAVLLSSLSFREDPPLSAEDLLNMYKAVLRDNGLGLDEREIRRDVEAAVRLLIRGSIGWAGKEDVQTASARMLELQFQTASRTETALRWLDA